jgi:uncharacterized membrane protein
MSLAPFLTAPLIIQIHAFAALMALLAGPVALYGRKGHGAAGRWHRRGGYLWFVMMALTALSSFGIGGFGWIGPFSPIHLLSISTLTTLWLSFHYARSGRVIAHQRSMRSLYWYGLVIAGILNFLPGRTTNRALLGEAGQAGIYVIALAFLALGARAIWLRRFGDKARGPLQFN